MVATARWTLWAMVLGLCGIGLIMVASTTTTPADPDAPLVFHMVSKQAVAMVIGLFGALVISHLGPDLFIRSWVVALFTATVVAMLILVPMIGRQVNGAWRWFDLGPIKIQPAELAKLMVVVAFAWYLSVARERIRVHWHGALVPIVGFLIIAMLVLRTRDLGTILIIGVGIWGMLYFAGARWLYTTILGLYSLPLAAYVTIFQESYRLNRVLAFSDPWHAPGAAGYHLQQSAIAIGSGGIFGVGLGQGPSKSFFLPEKHTDFIYAVICEELGMIGGLTVAVAYLVMIACGLVIANRANERFPRLLAVGATVTLGFQAFWNMLVATGAVPTKGMTLPLISYGGSSVVVSLALVGLIDAVARRCPERAAGRRTTTGRIGAAPKKSRASGTS